MNPQKILLVIAIILFILAGVNVAFGPINLLDLGLACFAGSFM